MPVPSESLHPPRYVHVQTFGCQMNVYDTDRIFQALEPFNYTPTDDPARANLILLNTCSVRDKAEQKMMSQLGRLAPLKEYNDDLILGVAGCVAQQEGDRLLKKIPYLDLVFGPDHVQDLPKLLDRVRSEEGRVSETTFFKRKNYEFIEAKPREASERVSEFVTIMKGCDKVCTFCIVPFTRGREVSKSRELIVKEVENLVAVGVKEVTLLGQNVNSYGKDKDREVHFDELLRAVDQIEGLERVRFTTSHPMDCTDGLVDCFGELRTLAEYFHLPVQSGSDRVLEAMGRHYTIDHYRERVARLRERAPDMALSTDIIVGFPGETEEEFEETMALLREVRYDSIFAFKYSQRPGTKAAEMEDTVPEPEKTRRLDEVLKLQNQITAEKMLTYAGEILEVLVEGPSRNVDKGRSAEWQMTGRTRTNVIVNFRVPMGDFWSNRLKGQLVRIRIDQAKAHSLYGEMV